MPINCTLYEDNYYGSGDGIRDFDLLEASLYLVVGGLTRMFC